MKKEKIFKMRFFDCKFNHLENGVTECIITFDFNTDLFVGEFGDFSYKTVKGINNLNLTFEKCACNEQNCVNCGSDCENSMHLVAKGYSKCSPEDSYDRVKGERIAESKAKKNAYRIGYRIGKVIEKETRRKLVDIIRFNEQMFKCENCEKQHALFVEQDRN